MYNEYVTLSNGVKIPQLGLGTWLIDDDKCSEVVKKAVENKLNFIKITCSLKMKLITGDNK